MKGKLNKVKKIRQVIVGNSAASLNAIKAIRETDSTCSINLISAENSNAYSPVFLTYYLKGKITREDLFISNSDFYKMNNVKTLFGIKAIGLDPLKQIVFLENGREVEYDNCLIATGASPIKLGNSGNELDNVFSLRTIEDAERILKCAQKAKEVIVIGAGLIGLQVAEALFRERRKLTIMEWAGQVLPETTDADCASIVQKEIESRGVSIFLGKKVKEIRRKSRNKAIVIADSGEELVADMVIVGIGMKPNIQLVKHCGIKVNKGILVDELMRTNFNNVFAGGDVSEGNNLVTGKKEVLLNWCNACRQGKIAGLNMAGHGQRYEGGLRETIATIWGLTIAVIGLATASENDGVEELRFFDPEKKSYRKILLAGNRIVGIVLMNMASDAGVLGNFIRNKKDILPWKDRIVRTPFVYGKVINWPLKC